MMKILAFCLLGLVGAAQAEPTGWNGSVGGNRLAVEFVGEGVLRVRFALGNDLAENGTGVTVPQPKVGFPVSVEENGERARISDGRLEAAVDRTTGRISFTDCATRRLLLSEAADAPHRGERLVMDKVVYDEKSARTEHTANGDVTVRDVLSREKGAATCRYAVKFGWKSGESLYGLGSHVEDTLDLRGHEVFLTQHNLKAVIPVIVSTEGYGLLFDVGSAMRFDDRDGAGLFEVEAAKTLDYYFIRGDRFDDVIARYRRLTGPSPMMPRYMFGYVQSKERYRSSADILATLRRYRELKVPVDVIVQDWNYWPQGWGYMKMDPRHYPDPAALADGVHRLNARLMISIWPNPQHCPQADEFAAAGHMLPHDSYNPFLAAAREHYWQWVNREFFSRGFDAWWCDCSEPVDGDWKKMPAGYGLDSGRERWKLNTELLNATTGAERSQLYSLYHARGIYEGQRRTDPRKRVVNLTRSSYAGQQRYATITWNGDTCADWQSFRRQIPSGLNFMAAGCPYWTVDAGGFFVRPQPPRWFWNGKFPGGVNDPAYREYYVRMLEWAAYLPMMRSHGTDTPREIWNFGKRGTPHFDAIEKTIRARYELLPYIYSVAARVSFEGYTMTRLLAFDFPDDWRVRDLKDEYMFGPSLLVAPVTEPSAVAREVYLPRFRTASGEGAWYDCRSGARSRSGESVRAAAPLDSIPVFQKSGSIVVRGPAVEWAEAQRGLPLTVTVAPGGDAEFALYDDEGDGYGYEEGRRSVVRLSWNEASRTFTAGAREGTSPGEPVRQSVTVKVIGLGERTFDYSGQAVSVSFSP